VKDALATVRGIFGGSGSEIAAKAFEDAHADGAQPGVPLESPEEVELLASLRARVTHIKPAPRDEFLLMCLRGRKHDVTVASTAVVEYGRLLADMALDEYGDALYDATGRSSAAQLETFRSRGVLAPTGGVDRHGRPALRVRLRYHDPSNFSAWEMARLITHTLTHLARTSTAAQAQGIVLVVDMSGASLRHFDLGIPRYLLSSVLPRMPVRVGQIIAYDPLPPFRIIFPVARALMKPKMRDRIRLVRPGDAASLAISFAAEELPDDLPGGQLGTKEADARIARSGFEVSTDATTARSRHGIKVVSKQQRNGARALDTTDVPAGPGTGTQSRQCCQLLPCAPRKS